MDNTGYVGEGISIAIDNNNKVHISYSYWDGAKYNLKYATNVSGSWVYTTLDDTTHTGGATSIAIDNNNKVHISYTTVYNGSLRYATNASGTWIFTNLSSSCNDLSGEIAIDNNNKVHIVYSNNSYLKYATNVSGSWVYSSLGYGGQFPSIAIDSNNKVHISDQGRWYITNVSGSWVRANVDSSDAGNNSHSSIVIDSNNKIHISYYAPGKKGLKLAEPNISPVLLWTGETNYTIDGMNPDVVKQGENVTFRIKYSDVDEDVPASGYPKVHIKKGTSEVVVYPMTYVSGDYNTGAIYTCIFALSLSAGEDYSYYFEAKDEWQDVAENTQEKVFTIKGVSYGVLTGRITKVYGDGTTGVGNATVQILQNGVLKAENKNGWKW